MIGGVGAVGHAREVHPGHEQAGKNSQGLMSAYHDHVRSGIQFTFVLHCNTPIARLQPIQV